ncbi:hypothetical protein JCM10213_000764 [Rhodosporidiobolus nylandii]
MTANPYPPAAPPAYAPTTLPPASLTPASSQPASASTNSLKPSLPTVLFDMDNYHNNASDGAVQTPVSEVKTQRKGPVIFGFDLSEMSFHAFKTAEMMDKQYHLRKERIIAYQLAMLVCLAAECCATYSLSKYEDLQGHIETNFPPAHLYQNDIIDMEILTIVMCVMVACLFGADFFFLVQFPRQTYPQWYQKTKKALAVTVTSGVLAAAIGFTVVVARNSAKIEHVSQEIADAAAAYYYRPPLTYRKWAVNIAALCLLWPGWVFCVISTIYLFIAADYDYLHGTAPRGYPVENSSSTQSITGVPLATPPALNTTTDPRMSTATGSTLPGSGVDKLVLPPVDAPGGRLDVETDHAALEGGRYAAENRV